MPSSSTFMCKLILRWPCEIRGALRTEWNVSVGMMRIAKCTRKCIDHSFIFWRTTLLARPSRARLVCNFAGHFGAPKQIFNESQCARLLFLVIFGQNYDIAIRRTHTFTYPCPCHTDGCRQASEDKKSANGKHTYSTDRHAIARRIKQTDKDGV